jgi:hypothetical protein
MSSSIIYRKGQKPEEIEREQLRNGMQRGPPGQLNFLLELIHLSAMLCESSKDNRNMSLFQKEVIAFFTALQKAVEADQRNEKGTVAHPNISVLLFFCFPVPQATTSSTFRRGLCGIASA